MSLQERLWDVVLVHLLGLHLPAGEVFDTVHEAVLRHLVVGPQKLLKLKHKHTRKQVQTTRMLKQEVRRDVRCDVRCELTCIISDIIVCAQNFLSC